MSPPCAAAAAAAAEWNDVDDDALDDREEPRRLAGVDEPSPSRMSRPDARRISSSHGLGVSRSSSSPMGRRRRTLERTDSAETGALLVVSISTGAGGGVTGRTRAAHTSAASACICDAHVA